MEKKYFFIMDRTKKEIHFANQLADPEWGVIKFARPGSKQYAAIQNLAKLLKDGGYSEESLQRAAKEASDSDSTNKFKITIQVKCGRLYVSISDWSICKITINGQPLC